MEKIEVDILDLRAKKILETLAGQKCIVIRPSKRQDFRNLLKRLRSKGGELSLGAITKEVEAAVRAKRFC